EQRPVDVWRPSRERHSEQHAAQLVVHEHGAVAVPPVQGDEPVRTHWLLRGEGAEPGVRAAVALAVLVRHAVLDIPAEDVADAALSRLVTPHAGGDAAADHAAHARDLGKGLTVHDVAR